MKARQEKKLVLIASLPRNDAELARAVRDAGADAVKIHMNVHHHATTQLLVPLMKNEKN
jgi:hypothetical protein